MTRVRLDMDDPALVVRIRQLDPNRQRRLAVAAARLALETTGVETPAYWAVLRSLAEEHVVSAPEREAITRLAEHDDDVYFDLHDQFEQGRRPPEDYQRAYRRALAASAVVMALDDDPEAAALEAVYEALHTVDEELDFAHAAIEPLLRSVDDSVGPPPCDGAA